MCRTINTTITPIFQFQQPLDNKGRHYFLKNATAHWLVDHMLLFLKGIIMGWCVKKDVSGDHQFSSCCSLL